MNGQSDWSYSTVTALAPNPLALFMVYKDSITSLELFQSCYCMPVLFEFDGYCATLLL
jgi:hypothetical protein